MSIIESAIFQEVSTEEPENKPPRIMLRHSQTNKVVETVGAVLEAQFMDGDNHLLFISEGIPYEESLHILLISSDLIIKDSIELSAAYTPGMLRNIRIVQPNKIQFSFFNPEETWVLELLEKPYTQLWGNRFPVKRKSPFLHTTWLALRKAR